MSLDFGEGAKREGQIALARKWRPARFAEVVGQEHAVRTLSNALATGRLHHAYMFTGTRGIGKTTLARILAKGFNCPEAKDGEPCCECSSCRQVDAGNHPDVIEMDAASTTQVDSMRELLDTANYAPSIGPFKVYIIDEVHMLSRHSFNAMLKTLEEPPAHIKFILATTDPQQVPATVQSRCLRFALRRLPREEIASHLAKVLEAEGNEHDGESLELIASRADGSVRDALSVLDEALAADGSLGAAAVRDLLGMAGADLVPRLMERIVAGDAAGAVQISADMHAEAVDPDGVLAGIAEAVHRGQLAQVSPGLDDGVAASLEPIRAQLLYDIATKARASLPVAPDPKAAFDMALLRMVSLLSMDLAALAPGAPAARPKESPASGPSPDTRAGVDSPAPAAPKGVPADAAQWEAFSGSLDPRTQSLAKECSFASLDGDTINLVLDPAKEHLRANEEALAREVKKRYGDGASISIAISGGEKRGEGPSTPAAAEKEREREKDRKATEAIEGSEEMRKIKDAFPNSTVEGAGGAR